MRFQSVLIEPPAIVDVAYLTFNAFASDNGANCLTRISAEDVDDAPTFADNAAAFDTRWAGRTTARVDWDNIATWVVDTNYTSPSIITPIQEVIDRGGWGSGNDIVLFWDDFEDRSTHASDNNRFAKSWDTDSSLAPKLHIEFHQAAAGVSNLVGRMLAIGVL
jgi:hypothetical protein